MVGSIAHQGYFHGPARRGRLLVFSWSGHGEQLPLLVVVNYYHAKPRVLSVEDLLVFGAHVGDNAEEAGLRQTQARP